MDRALLSLEWDGSLVARRPASQEFAVSGGPILNDGPVPLVGRVALRKFRAHQPEPGVGQCLVQGDSLLRLLDQEAVDQVFAVL